MDMLKNLFINKVLKNMVDGDKGSTVLGTLVTAILALDINYAKAIKGFQFQDPEAVGESAKLVGGALLWVWSFFIGRKRKETTT